MERESGGGAVERQQGAGIEEAAGLVGSAIEMFEKVTTEAEATTNCDRRATFHQVKIRAPALEIAPQNTCEAL